MTNTNRTHPFAKRKMNPTSRRSFTKGMLTASLAFATVPLVLPSVANASTGIRLATTGSLQDVIAEQLARFSGQAISSQTMLESAARNDAFLEYLRQRLGDFHPASAS